MNKLSIIIVSWRVKELLKECLQSIFDKAGGFDFEVIVVDNNSGDGSAEMVQENFPQVKLIASQINLGFARGNNLGLKQATGDYFLLLNPDTKLIDNNLTEAIKFMKNNQQVGILGCKLLNYDLSLQPSVRRFPNLRDHLVMMFKLHHLFKLKRYLAEDFDYTKPGEADQVMGAFFLISKKLYRQIGPLDEGYYIWLEEVDYCQRAKKADFKVFYWPGMQIIHYGGESFKKARFNLRKNWIYCQSRLRYIRKHQDPFSYLIILILTPISLLGSLVKINFRHVK